MILLPPVILSIAFAVTGNYFLGVDPDLARTFLILLLVDASICFYIMYRGYHLPEKYKRLYQSGSSK